MAWSAPRIWIAGDMATAALLNTHIRDNLLALSTHAHGGAAGDGNDELSGLDFANFDDLAANPSTAGRIQKNGANLIWGAANFNLSNEYPAAATGGRRSLGATATTAKAGDHTH